VVTPACFDFSISGIAKIIKCSQHVIELSIFRQGFVELPDQLVILVNKPVVAQGRREA